MKRSTFLFDGFNLYHSIDNNPTLHRYKWLNIVRLAACYITKQERIHGVFYFTAYATWDIEKLKRHHLLITVFKDLGVEIVQGAFRKRLIRCSVCGSTFSKHEEKRTDVNIAVKLIDLAHKNSFDIAYIVSGDSDLIPAVEYVKRRFPQKELKVVIPYNRKADELVKACGGDRHRIRIKRRHMNQSLLPDPYVTKVKKSIACPKAWK